MSKISDVARKKAQLIHYGKIYVPESLELPFPLSSSTAGPGAGKKAFALSFGGTRIKLGISRDPDSLYSLSQEGDGYQILKHNEIYIEKVDLIPTLLHAPNQAFVNLRDGCIYSCEFCATPELTEEQKKDKDPEQVIRMILEAAESEDFESVAITSGVVGSPKETINELVNVITSVREHLPDVEIGVEPYIEDVKDIKRLRAAGATEIKINIESFDREIFHKICPDLDYDIIMKMLEHAVSIFGKGKVTTNILLGLGESYENVFEAVEHLAKMGVVPVLRVLRINDLNHDRIVRALGHDIQKVSSERMLKLAERQKSILTDYGLTTGTFETMCHKCGCCDIVPFRDI
jgi:biotin synthase-related radical SAM superfamily protein